MKHALVSVSLHRDFESIRKVDAHGIEYWEARELMELLGYVKWQNFQRVIQRARSACRATSQAVLDHFMHVHEPIRNVRVKREGSHQRIDYQLSRLACYLIAQNGDPRKPQIAFAQTYFVVQARRQELQQLMEDDRRIIERQQASTSNKQLFETAQQAGVEDFRGFNNAGYLGLYEMIADEIREHKGIGKDEILDRAGSTELAANLFRITQTDAKIKKEGIEGEMEAEIAHHEVGKKVRETIKQIGGTMPEELAAQEHIQKVMKRKLGIGWRGKNEKMEGRKRLGK